MSLLGLMGFIHARYFINYVNNHSAYYEKYNPIKDTEAQDPNASMPAAPPFCLIAISPHGPILVDRPTLLWERVYQGFRRQFSNWNVQVLMILFIIA